MGFSHKFPLIKSILLAHFETNIVAITKSYSCSNFFFRIYFPQTISRMLQQQKQNHAVVLTILQHMNEWHVANLTSTYVYAACMYVAQCM